jgi:quinol-cytochrome oxidoreductase complex cytochrome b subunit
MQYNFINILTNALFSIRIKKNISYFWNFGSILRIILVLQILSRLFLTIYFIGFEFNAFYSVLVLHLNVNFGWIIRFIHANGASIFLLLVFIHICRRLFYVSFNKSHLWNSRITILLLVIGTAFLGYVLPW